MQLSGPLVDRLFVPVFYATFWSIGRQTVCTRVGACEPTKLCLMQLSGRQTVCTRVGACEPTKLCLMQLSGANEIHIDLQYCVIWNPLVLTRDKLIVNIVFYACMSRSTINSHYCQCCSLSE